MTRASRSPSRSESRLVAAVMLAVLAAASGCGSTAQGLGAQQSAAATTGRLGDGSGAGPAGAVTNPVGETAGSQQPAPALTGNTPVGLPPSAPIASGGVAPSSAAPVGAAAAAKPSGPILLGFIAGKCSNCGAALGPGYKAGSYSDRDFEQGVVDGLNSRGGIGGRLIKPIFAEVDTASPDWSSNYQAACATFTEDNHVVAVLGYSFAYMENFAACLAKAGVLWINGGYAGGDKQVYVHNQNYFTHVVPTLDEALLISVSSAVADGWVTSKSRLGILQTSCPSDVRAFNNTLKPYLAAQRLNLVANHVLDCVNGARDQGNAVAGIQNAVLKMHSDGVDNVIITAIPLILFAENAESQGWRPHYLAFFGGAAYEPFLTAEQLKNIHAAGWLPTLDLNATQLPPLTPAQRTCKDLLARGKVDTPPAQYTAAFIACDGVLLYARAVQAAGGDASPTSVRLQLERLGGSYASAMTLNGATTLSRDRHAAPRVFRSNVYKTACSCFQYVGPVRAFPRV